MVFCPGLTKQARLRVEPRRKKLMIATLEYNLSPTDCMLNATVLHTVL